MTTPDERTRALLNARDFLRDLLDPKKTPKVPKNIRSRAHSALRHYPGDWQIEAVTEALPQHFDNIFMTERKKLIKGLINE